ncbi:MAG: hypothetical protein GYA51_02895 [Candidatus Methanofastidiosa archaeon]|jgi:hypothetical protein|nr:hypothetical protein [Candidatus Methanofastidiosa archaeon]
MGNKDFFKDFNIRGGFSSKTFLSEKYTVCVREKGGKVVEHHDITDPWKYIAKLKRDMNIEAAWIKDE